MKDPQLEQPGAQNGGLPLVLWSLHKIDLVDVGEGGCRENRRENQTAANRGKWRRMVVSTG
jgi:hypothetical protein